MVQILIIALLLMFPCSLWAQTKIDLTTQVKSSTLTTNTIPKWTGSTGFGNGCVLDDGTHAVRCDKGFDVNSLGAYVFWAVNNTSTGTTVNKMACDDGTGKVIICPSASSTTNDPLGVAVAADGATPGTSGSTGICIIGFCSVIMDNSATAGHYAQSSSTVNGDLSDVGATIPTNGQSYWRIFTGNSGAGTAAVFRNLTPSELNASGVSGGNGKSIQIQINGTAITKPIANLVNGTGITFATGNSGNTTTITPTVSLSALTFPEVKIIPAANCPNATPGSGWSYASSTWTAACRAGTNNLGGALQLIPSTGGAAQFRFEIPADWDSASQPFIRIEYASGANTSGTVIWTVASACTKADGSITDDPSFVAESAFGTQTMATANRAWSQTGQFTAITSGNNCVGGGGLVIKLTLSGTAASAINAYQAVITTQRLPVVQAN
jgi:hypothetical protein